MPILVTLLMGVNEGVGKEGGVMGTKVVGFGHKGSWYP